MKTLGAVLAGLVLPAREIPPTWHRPLMFIPVALLTALVTASLTSQADGVAARLAAAGVGALVAHRTGQLWACIASGMLLYWVLTLV
jgi:branched-subunit amino acid transport protein